MSEERPWKWYPVSSPSQAPHPYPTPSSTYCQPLSCVPLAWIPFLFLTVSCHLSRSPQQQPLFHPAFASQEEEEEEATSSHTFLPPFFDSLPSWFSGPLPCVHLPGLGEKHCLPSPSSRQTFSKYLPKPAFAMPNTRDESALGRAAFLLFMTGRETANPCAEDQSKGVW